MDGLTYTDGQTDRRTYLYRQTDRRSHDGTNTRLLIPSFLLRHQGKAEREAALSDTQTHPASLYPPNTHAAGSFSRPIKHNSEKLYIYSLFG